MPDDDASVDVFPDDYGGVEGVALVLKNLSIVEYEGELVAGCKLSPEHALRLADALIACATDR